MRVWQRTKRHGFTRHLYGDIVIHEGYRSVPCYSWGRRNGKTRQQRYWRVYNDKTSETIGDHEGYELLRDAKAAANEHMDKQRAQENAQ